ncbi:phytosulfokines 3-like [Zingiber officinale]|uniref:Phytosulfokine n=1 Tax=Zingiber officinale TaxID=94328 RepID=A0A8J5HZF7_ZINOF|nr:phytosulfokines 3-like [Zingiber officinale]KAG6532655.1 hypothetical protein ZIOFF_006505 [Zingiber officinale]
MSKFAALFVVALLLLNGTLSRAARPAPADPSSNGRQLQPEAKEEEECGGGEEECLMRRTLAAHTDYIYTQNKQP